MRAALLLDRDGVINLDKNYVHKVEDFIFVDGIFELCRRASNSDMAIVVVTNQAGIGRGYYTESQFWALTNWMCERFGDQGSHIDAVYFCPYHPEHGIGIYRKDSFDRKPNPGMILRAQQDLSLDLQGSVMIGDKQTDAVAAHRAGVGRIILLNVVRDSTDSASETEENMSSLQDVTDRLFPLVA